jgi:glycosyltransferase involved in cell wall biosynthesis
VLKRYPRYSETFVVNEILAHEAAGVQIDIFSLRPPNDDHFQDSIAQVRAPVTYLPSYGLKAADFWKAIQDANGLLPGVCTGLEAARGEDVRDVHQALMLAREVKLRGITHLHAHFASVATSVARLAAHFAGVPYTFTAHAKDIFHESVSKDDLRRKLEDAAGVVTVSRYNVDFLGEISGPARSKIARIYNGLHLDQFPYRSPQERAPLVVGVGRLVEKKGFCDLVYACALLARKGVDFRCLIIGTGDEEARLREQIERLGLGDTVELIGPKPQFEVKQYVSSAAVFAAPCVVGSDGNRDGLPTVLLEAMALGTPCVSTDVTGIPEVLRDGKTGLMVPQHNPAKLAEAIERLLHDSQLRVNIARSARRLIEDEFSIDRNSVRIRALFEQAAPANVREPVEAVGARA